MRVVLLAALLFCASLPVARAGADFGEFRPYFTAKQNYAVHAEKSPDSRVVSRIKPGDDVFVAGGEPGELPGGVQGLWLRVAHGPEGKAGAGYIFGDVFLDNDSLLHGDTRFAYTRKLDGERGLAEITFRALDKNGRLLAESPPVTTLAARPVLQRPLDGKGLAGVQYILHLYVSGEACGIPDCHYYYAWTGTELALLPDAISLGGAGMDVTYDEKLVFPSDGAPGNAIIKVVTATEYCNESEDDYRVNGQRHAARIYLWDGKRAVPQQPAPELLDWFGEHLGQWHQGKR